jgi:[ribosomal protein S5]-alanine N-acetyltransferase
MQTTRLTIRRFTLNDQQDVFAYAKDPDVGPLAGWRPHRSEKESLHIIKHLFLRNPYSYAIVNNANQTVIGSIGFTKKVFRPTYELGYSLHKDYWGQGLMSEAVQAMVQFGFEQLQATRLIAKTMTHNIASQKVLLKAGFTKTHEKKQHFRRYDGQVFDITFYELRRSQWRNHAKT